MDIDLETLSLKIGEQLGLKDTVVLAISGFGGAGKTTLADSITNNFTESAVMPLDDFVINRGKGKGWAGGFDWDRLEQLFKDIKARKNLHYQRYDWKADKLDDRWIDKRLPKLVIIEGVRLFQPKFMDYFDLSVWIDVDLTTATAQGVDRDRNKWHKIDNEGLEAHLESWQTVWVPKEKEFLEKFHPDAAADYKITNP